MFDAKPLVSGTFEQLGLPFGGVAFGTSMGPGSGGGVSPPSLISQVKPTYTPEALLHRIQGSVVLQLVVTREASRATFG
jgi:hypothetical protein